MGDGILAQRNFCFPKKFKYLYALTEEKLSFLSKVVHFIAYDMVRLFLSLYTLICHANLLKRDLNRSTLSINNIFRTGAVPG